MKIQVIDDVPRKGLCGICHKTKLTLTVAITSKESPIITTEDWCLTDYHTILNKTLTSTER